MSSQDKPRSFTPLLLNSCAYFAISPSSVVHTGVKSPVYPSTKIKIITKVIYIYIYIKCIYRDERRVWSKNRRSSHEAWTCHVLSPLLGSAPCLLVWSLAFYLDVRMNIFVLMWMRSISKGERVDDRLYRDHKLVRFEDQSQKKRETWWCWNWGACKRASRGVFTNWIHATCRVESSKLK